MSKLLFVHKPFQDLSTNVFLLAVGLIFASTSASAMDCKKASLDVEHRICASSDLRVLDIVLSEVYDNKLEEFKHSPELIADQKKWLKEDRNRCSDEACLQESYERRTSEIAQLSPDAYRVTKGNIPTVISPEAASSTDQDNVAQAGNPSEATGDFKASAIQESQPALIAIVEAQPKPAEPAPLAPATVPPPTRPVATVADDGFRFDRYGSFWGDGFLALLLTVGFIVLLRAAKRSLAGAKRAEARVEVVQSKLRTMNVNVLVGYSFVFVCMIGVVNGVRQKLYEQTRSPAEAVRDLQAKAVHDQMVQRLASENEMEKRVGPLKAVALSGLMDYLSAPPGKGVCETVQNGSFHDLRSGMAAFQYAKLEPALTGAYTHDCIYYIGGNQFNRHQTAWFLIIEEKKSGRTEGQIFMENPQRIQAGLTALNFR